MKIGNLLLIGYDYDSSTQDILDRALSHRIPHHIDALIAYNMTDNEYYRILNIYYPDMVYDVMYQLLTSR